MNGYRVAAILMFGAAALMAWRAWDMHDTSPGVSDTRAHAVARHAPKKPAWAPPPTPSGKNGVIAREKQLVVAFRLDSTLTRGVYMGDKWVSPPRYHFAQKGDMYVVQSKMQRIDEIGERSDAIGKFVASDPSMIEVMDAKAPGEVTLVVYKPGKSQVIASNGPEKKVLDVRAWEVPGGMQVEILQ